VSQPWFRYYAEALEDPKVQRLPDALFKTWVNLLCLAARNEGILPSLEDIVFALRLSEKDTQKRLDALVSILLLDRDGETLLPHNWNGRQFKSDDATERVKRYRERNKKQESNVSGNVARNDAVTLQETDSEADTEPERKIVPQTPKPDLQIAVDGWNDMASKAGLPKVQRLTDPRKRSLSARLAECGGLEGWQTALTKVRDSPFLIGENKSNWKADFDFLLQQKSFTKLMEGGYDGTTKSPVKPNSLDRNINIVRDSIDAQLEAALEAEGRERGGQ